MSTQPQQSFSKHFLAGGMAGTVGATILCPLEVVKTRLQSSLYQKTNLASSNPIAQVRFHVGGVIDLLSSIKKQEGLRALWKGLGPNLVGIVPARSIYFSVYNKGKETFTKMNNGLETPVVHMTSAAISGFCTALVTNPIWLVKTRMQLQSELTNKNSGLTTYRNSFHCFRHVLKEDGVVGLYRGLSASLLGLTESTFQFVMYEYFKATILARKRAYDDKITQISWIDTTLAASTAKLIAAITTYPHEVIRTRLRQTPENGVRKYVGLWQSGTLIYAQEGLGALYGGMTAHLLRVVPNAAILFLTYELIIQLL